MNWINQMLRKLWRVPPPKITSARATEIALAEMVRRGGSLLPSDICEQRPPLILETMRTWQVWLDPNFKPTRVVVIDNQSGDVMRYIDPPR